MLNVRGRMLFLDLDQTFADFDGGFIRLFGMPPTQCAKAKKWEQIANTPNFFRDLEPLPGAYQFYLKIRHLPHAFLTACPHSFYAQAAQQKREWSRINLDAHAFVIPALGSSNKPLFMHNPGDVILDDREPVCEAWEAAGGIAIHFTGDYEKSYTQIMQAWARPRPEN